MIKSLKTKNFRKLTDNEFVFTPGLNALLGANEAGKSTLLEAIAYALFGIKACRETLDKVVTWGNPERTLKVELVLEMDGVEYVITRSKAGAEVNYGGDGKVVGQGEVSAFLANLIGASGDAAGRLMLAKQGAIRGALDSGAAKTMELIESLADFGVLDRVVELIQTHCVIGPTKVAEDRVGRAAEALTAARAVVVAVDMEASKAKAKELALAIGNLREELATKWEAEYLAGEAAVRAAEQAAELRRTLKVQRSGAEDTYTERQRQLLEASEAANKRPDPAIEVALRAQLEGAEKNAQAVLVWNELQALVYPEQFWDQPRATLDAAIAQAQRASTNAQIALQAARKDEADLTASLQTGEGLCKSCGQTLPNAAAVAAHNAKIQAQLPAVMVRINEAIAARATAEEDVEAYQGVLHESKPFDAFAARYADLVDVADTAVPPVLSWKGEPPKDEEAALTLRLKLQEYQRQKEAADKAAARVEVLESTAAQDRGRLDQLDAQIAQCGDEASLPQLQAAHELVYTQYHQRMNDIAQFVMQVDVLHRDISNAEGAYERQMHEVAKAEHALETAEAELKSQEFNNALLKRVREARPNIADKLWGTIMSTVSVYFSQMRGERSTVSREANDFKIDGKSISGYSGSTLDALGLAIRLALTRTFLPTAPFLILDEPAAAMDDNRTSATLGFLVGSGFQQTLLVTHDATSETVAQNLLTLS